MFSAVWGENMQIQWIGLIPIALFIKEKPLEVLRWHSLNILPMCHKAFPDRLQSGVESHLNPCTDPTLITDQQIEKKSVSENRKPPFI